MKDKKDFWIYLKNSNQKKIFNKVDSLHIVLKRNILKVKQGFGKEGHRKAEKWFLKEETFEKIQQKQRKLLNKLAERKKKRRLQKSE